MNNVSTLLKVEELMKSTVYHDRMTYEECEDAFMSVVSLYSSHELNAWGYYKSVYRKIPRVYRLGILMDIIYIYYRFDMEEFFQTLAEILEDETYEEYQSRIELNMRKLEITDKNTEITAYRGINQNSWPEETALSYTFNRDVAQKFADRFAMIYGKGEVLEKKFYIGEIIHVTTRRNEDELIVLNEEIENLIDDIRERRSKNEIHKVGTTLLQNH